MQRINVKIKKLNENAILPKYGTEFSAGADLYACEGKDLTVLPHQTVFVHTGVAVEIPDGLVGLIYARSGLASKRSLAPANKVGVIDCDYRGEIIVSLHNHSPNRCRQRADCSTRAHPLLPGGLRRSRIA